MSRDLPEGVVDPDGADATTLAESEARDEADRDTDRDAEVVADAPANPDEDGASDPFVESAEIQQGLDPDLVTDEQADRG